MKILFLLTQDLESPSGMGRYWPMAHALAIRGHQVRIVALHSAWATLKSKIQVREGVIIEYVAPMHVIKSGSQKRYYSSISLLWVAIRATWALFRAAIKDPVNIIHVGKPHPMNSIAGYLASKIKSSVLCLDCDDFEAGSNRFGKHWQQRGVAFFETKMPLHARLVTTNTLFMKSKLLSWGCLDERILYLSNGIEREKFLQPKQEQESQLRAQLGLNDKFIVLYLGSLSLTNHPVDLLLNAMKIVSQNNSNVALLIVGGGEDYKKLRDQAEDLEISYLTHFVGRIEPEEVPLYYSIADVSLDPVHDDDASRGRSPLKLFESWANNVPFISSTVGDRPNLLGDPPAGYLCKPGDPDDLGKAIMLLLSNQELADLYVQRGQERVKDFYWDNLVRDLEDAYHRTVMKKVSKQRYTEC
jgi:glycosyltransferase involved in cell wall biosynthesis